MIGCCQRAGSGGPAAAADPGLLEGGRERPARRCHRDAAGRAGAADEHRGRRRRIREAAQRGHPLLPRVAGRISPRHADRRGDLPERPGRGRTHREDLHGPVHEQVRDALRYIQNSVIREKVVKRKDRAEATRIFNYPFPAIEESLVNAVYHRSYETAGAGGGAGQSGRHRNRQLPGP